MIWLIIFKVTKFINPKYPATTYMVEVTRAKKNSVH